MTVLPGARAYPGALPVQPPQLAAPAPTTVGDQIALQQLVALQGAIAQRMGGTPPAAIAGAAALPPPAAGATAPGLQDTLSFISTSTNTLAPLQPTGAGVGGPGGAGAGADGPDGGGPEGGDDPAAAIADLLQAAGGDADAGAAADADKDAEGGGAGDDPVAKLLEAAAAGGGGEAGPKRPGSVIKAANAKLDAGVPDIWAGAPDNDSGLTKDHAMTDDETLEQVARQHNVTVQTLIELNGQDALLARPGTILQVPNW